MSDGTTVRALQRLAKVMESTATDLHELAARARTLSATIEGGQTWRESVTVQQQPLIVERLAEVLDELARHGAVFRKAEARVLHDEGLSQAHIAALFGVTRQRVGALLADSPSRSVGRSGRPGRPTGAAADGSA